MVYIRRCFIINEEREGLPMANTETVSVRVSPETKDRIAKLTADNGLSNVDLFAKMLDLYELNEVKDVYPGRSDDVDAFYGSMKSATEIFRHSLEVAKTAKDTAAKERQLEIETSLKTIRDLQAKQDQFQEQIKNLTEANATLISDKTKLEKEIEELQAVVAEQKAANKLKDEVILQTMTDVKAIVENIQADKIQPK